jgi:ketosteroid isomerase-like protein
MSTEQQNIDVIKSAYAAFARGDIAAVTDLVSDDKFETWGVVSAAKARAPWHFQGKTKQDVPRYFSAVLGALEPLRFEPTAFAAAGAHVYATVDMEYKVRASGKTLVMRDAVMRFKLDRGRIVDARVYEDTANTLEALG